MRIPAIISVAFAIVFAAAIGLASAADQFATMDGVKAVPMSSSELDAVKGMHVHFFDGNGAIHRAGDKNEGNWYNNGSSDAEGGVSLVAPSYHGLCVATGVGVGGIDIPQSADQCP